GSSDAAATLWGLNRIYQTDFSTARLRELAAQLGSDVPFFLTGGAALGLGRGEKIESWETPSTYWLVLVKPPEGLSTPQVYQSGKAVLTSGDRARNFREVLTQGDPRKLADQLYNGLEPAAFYLLPRVESLKNSLLAAGACGALVSGSGPTVLGLASDEETAYRLAEKMKPQADFVRVAPTVSEGPRIIS
ncbi:MAG: 4-(cytidine 5'-diphospho)-2-C-methyl-D-erythritol kinase, partial [bacterium]